jgi:hypothetical protein
MSRMNGAAVGGCGSTVAVARAGGAHIKRSHTMSRMNGAAVGGCGCGAGGRRAHQLEVSRFDAIMFLADSLREYI